MTLPKGVYKRSDEQVRKLREQSAKLRPLQIGRKRPEVSGSRSGQWRGGRVVDLRGYIRVHKPDHPNCDTKGYVYEHRLVMEEHLGRYLKDGEMVKRNNNNRQDNRVENLRIVIGYEHTPIELVYVKPNNNTKIGYLAGLFEGEGHFRISPSRAKQKTVHYSLMGQITITNKDLELLNQAKVFLKDFNIGCSLGLHSRETNCYRLSISGWKEMDKFVTLVYPVLSGRKKVQVKLYIEKFRPLLCRRPAHTNTTFFLMWTKELFIEAMGVVDEINSYKQHNRGPQNQEYFKKLLGSL